MIMMCLIGGISTALRQSEVRGYSYEKMSFLSFAYVIGFLVFSYALYFTFSV